MFQGLHPAAPANGISQVYEDPENNLVVTTYQLANGDLLFLSQTPTQTVVYQYMAQTGQLMCTDIIDHLPEHRPSRFSVAKNRLAQIGLDAKELATRKGDAASGACHDFLEKAKAQAGQVLTKENLEELLGLAAAAGLVSVVATGAGLVVSGGVAVVGAGVAGVVALGVFAGPVVLPVAAVAAAATSCTIS